MRSLILIAVVFAGLVQEARPESAANLSRHLLIVVWDGMRPDFVTAENTPTLWKLANEGVNFRDHHAVYPPATHVNGTAMVTGVYPDHSGVIANYDYRPDINKKKFVSTEQTEVVRKGDEVSGGKYIAVPTLTELVRAAGGRTVVAGAKDIGFLLDRRVEATGGGRGVILNAGTALPQTVLGPIVAALGPFPSAHQQQDAWTTKALTDFLWKGGVPVFSLLWLGEPDLTQHESAPGSPAALAAIKSADDDLAAALAALDRQGARATTDIFVVSDHGFSTIERSVDLKKILADAGLTAMTEFSNEPKRGDIMLVGNGGTVLFYVIGRDPAVIRRLMDVLQRSDFAGVIFTRLPIEGAFRFADAKIDSANGPDVQMAFRWTEAKNQFDVPGMIDGDWNRQAGKGTHATLSKFDMHNTLIAAGPDFRHAWTDEVATGNVDLAPTILDILGIKAPPMDGRVLLEAMTKSDTQEMTPISTVTIQADENLGAGHWHQSLTQSQVGSTIYFDEGNGRFITKEDFESKEHPEPSPQD